jgi:hypothetical protein
MDFPAEGLLAPTRSEANIEQFFRSELSEKLICNVVILCFGSFVSSESN